MMARRRLISLAAAAAGIILFAWAIRREGAAEIVEGIRRVGWGLIPILAVSGLRFWVRAEAWRLCMPPGRALSRWRAFQAYLAADAAGNMTPLGLLASEPAKVLLTRHHLATGEAVASLAADNLIYAASALTMISLGAIVMLTTVTLPPGWHSGVVAALAAVVVMCVCGLRMLRGTWTPERGTRPAWRQRLAGLRDAVLGSLAHDPARVARIYSTHLAFHALALAEVYLTLRWLLGDRSPTLTQTIVFAAADRVTIILFKVVPLRFGVDEAISGALAPVLAIQSTVGVTLAVIRKVRSVFWMAIGLLLIAAHPVREAPATDRR